jgi:hypothetical protein
MHAVIFVRLSGEDSMQQAKTSNVALAREMNSLPAKYYIRLDMIITLLCTCLWCVAALLTML